MTNDKPPISFVTFGMFIIDEIEWQTPNAPEPKANLIGGAGTYAVLGARLAVSSSPTLPQTISWIVDIGSDFPDEVKQTIDTWKTNCVFRYDDTRRTTRAWNGYGANEFRAFKYLTPKVRLEVSSLNKEQIMARSFHMVCSPERCIDITTRLREARRGIDPNADDPVIVWEPIPDLCSPEQLALLQKAARNCTVISPNHEELKMFFPPEIADVESQAKLVARLMGWDILETSEHTSPSPNVVVREGSNGSAAYIHNPIATSLGNDSQVFSIHLPAYHTPTMSQAVTDPTGGGNTYLGALAIILGLVSDGTITKLPTYDVVARHVHQNSNADQPQASHDRKVATALPFEGQSVTIAIAMIYALIAASFAIEQNGTPNLTPGRSSNNEHEQWNGESVQSRLQAYLDRERDVVLPLRVSRKDKATRIINTEEQLLQLLGIDDKVRQSFDSDPPDNGIWQ